MFTTIIAFILILGLLILVHEFGHFIVAKKSGAKVEEFGLGFPPRLFGVRKGETLYSLNLFPIGGFVKIHGEEGKPAGDKNKDPDADRAFYNKPASIRAAILVAGVTMNLVLAIFLLGLGHWIGLPTAIEESEVNKYDGVKVQITQIAENSPAQAVDLKIGDQVKKMETDGQILEIGSVSDIQNFVERYQGENINVIIQRGSGMIEKEMVPRINFPDNEGPLGIGLVNTAIVSYPWYESLIKGFVKTFQLFGLIIVVFADIIWNIFTTGQVGVDIAGPVGIFNLTGQAAQLGFIYLLQLTAIISINLAIINILPFPALDGGRLLFLAIEKIKGSPVNQKIEGIAHTAGFFFLILLMIAITWRDIVRLF